MLREEKTFRRQQLEKVAEEMCLAARTAPKARGRDLLEVGVVSGEGIKLLSEAMLKIGERENHPTFIRDSQSILQAQAIVLLGARRHYMGLRFCGFCGFANCAEAEAHQALCSFVPGDLGIALGSAVSLAMERRVDNRIMYTVGKAAMEKGFFAKEVVLAYGVPLAAGPKNPFFDRK